MTTSNPTPEQITALEDMIARRMENAGETREQACGHISAYLHRRLEDMERVA